MDVVNEIQAERRACRLARTSAEFAGQVAVAVWVRKLAEDAACEALRCYAMACHCGKTQDAKGLLEALMAEYRRRREQQDLCW